MFPSDVLIVPEEVQLLHETLLLPLQPLSDSVHFPEMKQDDKDRLVHLESFPLSLGQKHL